MSKSPDLIQPDRGQNATAIHLVNKEGFGDWAKRLSKGQRAALEAQKFDGSGYQVGIVPDGDGWFAVGGVANPGSFKGYVPAFWGSDFDDLVRDDAELHEWLADGKIDRIAEHPIGGWFFRRQALKMPAYGAMLSAEQLDALAAYVRWIRKGDWRGELR